VIRALEVTILTGRPYAEQTQSFTDNAYGDVPAAMAGLRWEREALYARICRRVDAMMDSGLLDEAKALFSSGVPLDHPSMMGLGYRQLFRHLQGGTTLSDAIAEIKLETRRFAKRQMTWFSRDLRIRWFDMDEKTDPNTLLQGIHTLYEATNKHEEEKR
jgi:tRNA dimethylallyltransferase